MTTIPNVRTDTRLSYWRKILQKYQNQPTADSRNNLNFSAGLRRVQVKVLKAISASQGNPYNINTLRRIEKTMITAVLNAPAGGGVTPPPSPGHDLRTQAWANRVVFNGGTTPSTATQNAFDTFFAALDTAGIWNLMLYGLPMVPDSLTAAITPWVNTLSIGLNFPVNASFVSGDLSTTGLKGDGSTKRLGLGINPTNWSTIGLTASNTADFGIFLYMPDLASNPNASMIEVGSANSGNSNNDLYLVPSSVSKLYFESGGFSTSGTLGSVFVSSPPLLNGFYSGQRVSASDSRAYFANSVNAHAQLGSTATSAANAANNIAWDLFSVSNTSSPAHISFSNRTISFFGVCLGLTSAQDLALYNAVQAFRTAIGGGFN